MLFSVIFARCCSSSVHEILPCGHLNGSLGKQPTFRDAINGFPAKWRLRIKRRNSILMTCHYPDLGPTRHDQSEAPPRSGQWQVISIEFLRSFLKRQNVAGCFLRLPFKWKLLSSSSLRWCYNDTQCTSHFETVHEIFKFHHSGESYWAVLSCGNVYYVVQGGSCYWVCGWSP